MKINFKALQNKVELFEKYNFELKMKFESLKKENEIILENSFSNMEKCDHFHFHGQILHPCPIKIIIQNKIRQI